MTLLRQALLSLIALAAFSFAAFAGSSPAYVSDRVTARLITAENGVAPGAQVVSAALEVTLAEGWKTYWKSPGAVGYPVSIDWAGSVNLKDHELLWPAPTRFEAFDIENYGYEKAVTYPIKLMVDSADDALVLSARVNMLVCADLCVPEDFSLSLVLPTGTAIDRDAATLIAQAANKIPIPADASDIVIDAASLDLDAKRVELALSSANAFSSLSVIPDLGPDAAFGPPQIALQDGGSKATVGFDILSAPDAPPPLEFVVTDGARAAAFAPATSGSIQQTTTDAPGILWFFLLAFIGGVILNVMPCVLPVLSIKFTSVLKAGAQSPARVRSGFLMSALGVMAFMWALALTLIAIRAAGGPVGWGIQFQNPYFLTIMTAIVTLFAANMFGLFEIALPQSWNTKMADAGSAGSLRGDFAIGALAAVLATPCSAPFLGTAVTFALAGSALQTVVIFTALGLGLALPYLAVAVWPQTVRALPKPGKWMGTVKWVMGLLLAATALWLVSVLIGVIGWTAALIVAALLLGAVIAVAFAPRARAGISAAIIACALVVPAASTPPAQLVEEATSNWRTLSPNSISGWVVEGRVVFVDVTADWCLSCKANKALVLDRAPVAGMLASDGIIAMRGDWTRPDEGILTYLKENGRFGIPFNIVYGPGAPKGIALPELLTKDAVIDAINKASGAG
ncbi:protein-disulfide reductase DsbD domain-containing protein [uncultured Litoreibacter sp.]|uniref:protein-disulfide reductase DsbD family protein n=1 Tax=uncultured Litoreibacter sp. TaxID=1392394 RepID=UPI00260D700C|nr:protein-disulfide reductase DsbD domain-containing protein [uncultured Litoreibacter sp.]